MIARDDLATYSGSECGRQLAEAREHGVVAVTVLRQALRARRRERALESDEITDALVGATGIPDCATSADGEEPDPSRKLTRQELLAANEELHSAYIEGRGHLRGRSGRPGLVGSTTSRVWETIRQMDFLRDEARSVDCRSHTCRIEVDDDGTAVLHKNLPALGQ